MCDALLELVTGLLTAAGIPAGEEYPGGMRPEIASPVAVVGLRELDAAEGVVRFRVQVLSPRLLGGWCCQTHGVRVVQTLTAAGFACQTAQMEYQSGSDCFCVTVEAALDVVATADGWEPGSRCRVFCGEAEQAGVAAFTASRDQQRRLVGAHWDGTPVGVTPGAGGWRLELIQLPAQEPEPVAEPFVLTVQEGSCQHRYTGCCWNETIWEYTQGGARLTRRGFALEREVLCDG